MNFKKFAVTALAGVMAVSMLSGCGLNKGAIVTKLGNETLTLGMVNFMARYEQAAMDDLYKAYFGMSVWDQDLYGNGTTMKDETVSDVLNTLHELMTLSQSAHMEEYGVTVSDEEMAKIEEVAANFMNANSKEALNEMGATKDLVKEMLRLFTIKSKMHAAMIETADTTVTDEEANMRGYTVVSAGITTYYDSEQGAYVAYTEDEIAEIKETMGHILDELSNPTDLEALAEEHGMTASYKTYAADDSSMETGVKELLDMLQVGEVSSLTTDNAVYIVRLDQETDAEATEKNRETIINNRKEAAYSDVLTAWQEDDGFDANVNAEQLTKISFKNNFTQSDANQASSSTEADVEAGTEAE